VPIYRLTRGRVMGKVGRAPVLLLTSTGRRSGQPRTAPVLFLADGEALIVIGSNAGNKRAPAWSHNLKANPDADVQIRGERRSVRARVAEGAERSELWAKMNAQYAGFDDYEERTSREIAVFVLEPR
jgi:deazaflavin-dependent oxidoreductase (nitroreductase family)